MALWLYTNVMLFNDVQYLLSVVQSVVFSITSVELQKNPISKISSSIPDHPMPWSYRIARSFNKFGAIRL